MTTSALAMRNPWRRCGSIAPGGTVLGIAFGAPGQVWLATAAGLWQRDVGHWRSLGVGLPLRASALASAGGRLIAGDAAGGIRYSGDNGRTWHSAWVDQTTSAVMCFAVSPGFARDRVLLAGTAGAGILRSSDGGTHWQLANVGLTDFTVLALAVAPVWEPREIAFAAADDTVYRSPNGGRAWKRSDRGMEGVGVQALAISPLFAADATVYAGSEQHGIYRSVDGGNSWQPLPAAASLPAINCLCCFLRDGDAVPTLIAGTGDGTLIRSTDRGESWGVVAADGWPALALDCYAGRIYAGLDDGGLLFSDDAGLSWQSDDQLVARDITRLAAGEGSPLIAFGPAGGAWCADSTRGWRTLAALRELGTLYALTCSQQSGWFAAADAGQRRSVDFPWSSLAFRGCGMAVAASHACGGRPTVGGHRNCTMVDRWLCAGCSKLRPAGSARHYLALNGRRRGLGALADRQHDLAARHHLPRPWCRRPHLGSGRGAAVAVGQRTVAVVRTRRYARDRAPPHPRHHDICGCDSRGRLCRGRWATI